MNRWDDVGITPQSGGGPVYERSGQGDPRVDESAPIATEAETAAATAAAAEGAKSDT